MNQHDTYYYDPERCTYVKVEPTWVQRLKPLAGILGVVLVLTALAVGVLDAQWIATPEEQALKTENQKLRAQLAKANAEMNTLASRLDDLAERDQELYRTLFEMEPISSDVREMGVGGTDPYASFDRFSEDTAQLLKETASTLDQLERQVSLQGASYRELSRVAANRSERLAQLPAIRPANGSIVSGYGMRHHPILKVRKMHAGVDFLLKRGTPVVATAHGVVKRTGHTSTYGKYIELRHKAAGYVTRYAHLSEIGDGIRRGVSVDRGQQIGLSGNTGRSTGPHLHYEVRDLEGRTLDPMNFFVPDMTPETFHQLQQRSDTYEADSGRDSAPMDGRSRDESSADLSG
jgi:murein DD-endopeptidase MepM/ murein hydrolase activator NlpD